MSQISDLQNNIGQLEDAIAAAEKTAAARAIDFHTQLLATNLGLRISAKWLADPHSPEKSARLGCIRTISWLEVATAVANPLLAHLDVVLAEAKLK